MRSLSLSLLCLIGALACNRDKGEETGLDLVDEDGDGYLSDEDCDDANPAVHPDASETCDGLDENCDGAIDEGLETTPWYEDVDSDGYGRDASAVDACAQPVGYVAVGGDCDDLSTSYYPGADETDCTDPNDYNCDGSVGYEDADGDRFPACLECDDGDATAYPGADEVCDGVDDDCNGEIDDDASDAQSWFIDYDTDGYGSDRYTELSCDQPEGYVDNADDCDDQNDNAFPGGDEVCDDADNDCDGEVDEDSALDASTWYLDSDADGFGVPEATIVACVLPDGYAATDDDCDDTSAAVNPDAAEVCNDGVDDDCDGEADGADAEGGAIYYVDADGDGYGLDDFSITACEQPDAYSTVGGDCYDDGTEFGAGINPAAEEICDDLDNNCDGAVDEDEASDATTWYADLDGDGYGGDTSLTTSCERPDGYGESAEDCDDGDEEVFPGAPETCNDGVDSDCDDKPDGCTVVASDADTVVVGEEANSSLASGLSAPGDVNGDGEPDMLLNAPLADVVDTDVGAVYLASGELSSGEIAASAVGVNIYGGDSADDRAGSSSALSDLDGDGYDDVMIGAIRFSQTRGSQRGAVYTLFGPVSDDVSLATDYDARYTGEYQFLRLGVGVDALSDLDGDGSLDLVMGAGTYDGAAGDNTGGVFVALGPIEASTSDITTDTLDATFDGDTSGDGIGADLVTGLDIDGDGTDDMAVGNKNCDETTLGTNVGCMYVITEYTDGVSDIGDVSSVVYGEAAGDSFSSKISPAGDMDGDGYDDLLIGALGSDEVGENAGAAYILHGPITTSSAADATVRFLGGSSGDSFGGGAAGGGDADGDGNADVLVTATGADEGASGAGAVYLFLGPITSGDLSATEAYATVYGDDVDAGLGSAVQFGGAAGDATGDRIFISATSDDRAGSDAGAVFVFSALGL